MVVTGWERRDCVIEATVFVDAQIKKRFIKWIDPHTKIVNAYDCGVACCYTVPLKLDSIPPAATIIRIGGMDFVITSVTYDPEGTTYIDTIEKKLDPSHYLDFIDAIEECDGVEPHCSNTKPSEEFIKKLRSLVAASYSMRDEIRSRSEKTP